MDIDILLYGDVAGTVDGITLPRTKSAQCLLLPLAKLLAVKGI
ncbi:MAG: hypothetical protein R3E67_05525 [Pseudomonadales bacterium]